MPGGDHVVVGFGHCPRSSASCCSMPASRKALARVISFVVIVDYRLLRPFCCSLQFGKTLFDLLDPAFNLANAPVEFVKLTCNLVIGHVLFNRKFRTRSAAGFFRHPKPRAIGLFCQFHRAKIGPGGLLFGAARPGSDVSRREIFRCPPPARERG